MGEGVKLQFEVPGEAVPKLRARTFHARGRAMTMTPQKVIDYENRVRLAAHEAVRQFHAERVAQGITERVFPTQDAVRLTVTFYRLVPQSFSQTRRALALQGLIHPTSRPDGSNLVKSVEDGLNSIVFADDAQCVDTCSYKRYAEEALAVVEIETLPEPEPEPRVPAAETRLARLKQDAKQRAAKLGHALKPFRGVAAGTEQVRAQAACRACGRTALAEAFVDAKLVAKDNVEGTAVVEACA